MCKRKTCEHVVDAIRWHIQMNVNKSSTDFVNKNCIPRQLKSLLKQKLMNSMEKIHFLSFTFFFLRFLIHLQSGRENREEEEVKTRKWNRIGLMSIHSSMTKIHFLDSIIYHSMIDEMKCAKTFVNVVNQNRVDVQRKQNLQNTILLRQFDLSQRKKNNKRIISRSAFAIDRWIGWVQNNKKKWTADSFADCFGYIDAQSFRPAATIPSATIELNAHADLVCSHNQRI